MIGVIAVVVAFLVAADILLTLAVVRRLREHTERLDRLDTMMGSPFEEMLEALQGRQMLHFEAASSSGEQITSDMLVGRVGVLAFFSSDCTACTAEAAELVAAVRGGRLPAAAAVVAGEGHARDSLVHDLADTCTVVVDEGGSITRRFELPGVPTLLALNSQGAVVGAAASVRELIGVAVS